MFNAIRHLVCLLLLIPVVGQAQPEAPDLPCPASLPQPAPAPELVFVAAPAPAIPATDIVILDIPEQTFDGQTTDLKQPSCTEEAVDPAAYDTEKRKTFEKTFKVNKSDALSIENKFGRVHVNTWDRNEIQVKVDVISRAGNDRAAQDLLNKINIADSRSGNTILIKTVFAAMRNYGGNRSFEINYTINMPEENALSVKQSFGDVYLAALKGKVDINIQHGALKSERLSNPTNSVKIAYGSGRCGYINGGNVDIAYSELNLGGANGLQGSSKFSSFKIGSLNETLDLNLKHVTLSVDNASKNVRKINVASEYSPISLNFEDNTAFDFDVNVQFGDFKVDKTLVNYTNLEKGHTSAEYKGKFGSSSSKGSVSIISKYGDVKFTK